MNFYKYIITLLILIILSNFTQAASNPQHPLRGTMEINSKGHLVIGGVDVVNLANTSEYPIYVIDEEYFRNKIRLYKLHLNQNYVKANHTFYPAKRAINRALCKIIEQEGLGITIATEGQLYTALQANFPPTKIMMLGNNKSPREIERALIEGVGYIVVDNMEEILLLEQIAKRLGKVPNVLISIKPKIPVINDVRVVENEFKFGFYITDPRTTEAIQYLNQSNTINFLGIHTYIAPKVLKLEQYEQIINLTSSFVADLYHKNIAIKEIILGGGFGVNSKSQQRSVDIAKYSKFVTEKFESQFVKNKVPLPHLSLELEYSVIADTGTTLYKVGFSKTSSKGIKYMGINGGIGDNLEAILFKEQFYAAVANKMNVPLTQRTKIIGKTPHFIDIIIDDITLPSTTQGDVIAVFFTGSNYALALNNNRLPIPGMVLVRNGGYDWIVRPQSPEEVARYDLVPERLE